MNPNLNDPRFHSRLNGADPLPGDFDAQSRQVDELLSVQMRRRAVPMGLSDRVFEASAKLLSRPRQPALRLVDTSADSPRHRLLFTWHRTAWGRVALAASVALAFGVAIMLAQRSPTSPNNRSLVVRTDIGPVTPASFNGQGEMIPAGSLDKLDSEMAYLLNTGEMTSLDDVHQELLTLVAVLEM
jgi:hypothetical protein